jgi:DNA-binding NarL/FixJ family response regulator
MKISIIVADPQPVMRRGMRVVLESEPDLEIVGEAADGLETVQLAARVKPNVAIFDLMMPGLSGLDALRTIREKSPETKVVFLSACSNRAIIADALRLGAMGYVFKSCTEDQLVFAVREASQGRRFLSSRIADMDIDAYLRQAQSQPLDPHDTLTAREREVLQMVAEGHSSPEIAARLKISHRTVENHRANLMHKLGLQSQSDLVLHAVRHGLIPLVKQ